MTTAQAVQDQVFKIVRFHPSEIEHRYGKNIHILSDPFLLSHLAQLCSENTFQPMINELITTLYQGMLKIVVNQEFPVRQASIRTRMAESHPEGIYQGPIIDPETPVVSVNLARAGTLPSHICYTALNYFMNSRLVRQDHISIGRTINADHQVTGSAVAGHKIGGPVDDSLVLFPDPMGATGATLMQAMDLYKQRGKAIKYIALHCIVTPEYIKRVQAEHPELTVYAIRLDRGLSTPEALATVPGTLWEQERGLNNQQYIVPGGGGFGEILNNAYV
jgi:uracil phosphoribosyltransferase